MRFGKIGAVRRGAVDLAFARQTGAAPTFVWLGGFKSDMAGTKAEALAAWADKSGRAFLRFDYSGHGKSGGRFEDGSIGAWTDDAAAVIAAESGGPLVLVGSSMGGWISLLLAARDEQGRRVMFGWLREERPWQEHAADGWAGVMTLPRILTLNADGRLVQTPVPEVETLRGPHRYWENISLPGDNLLAALQSDSFEMVAEIDPGDATHIGLEVRRSPDGVERGRPEAGSHAISLASAARRRAQSFSQMSWLALGLFGLLVIVPSSS